MKINNDEHKSSEVLIEELRKNLEEQLNDNLITEDEFKEQFIIGMNTILYQDCGMEYEVPEEDEENK